MTPISTPPTGFDEYWSTMLEELDRLPLAAETAVMPRHTTDFATVYAARFTSIGPYRLFAYFSLPEGEGPFPAIFEAPRYGSVNHAPGYEERQRYAVLTLCHRGQRLSDQPYAARYQGLLTEGIQDPHTYVYRGIVADCCRAVDFLLSRPEVDTARITAVGDDLAFIAAALRPQVDALYYAPGPFYQARPRAAGTSAYPLEEFNDYARAYPERAEAMWSTLAYFDPIHFADRTRAETLLVDGEADSSPLQKALDKPATIHRTAHSAYQDGAHQARWLATRYGFDDTLLPAQWQQR